MAKRVWTPEEIEKLKKMAAAGVSAVRVSLALKLPLNARIGRENRACRFHTIEST